FFKLVHVHCGRVLHLAGAGQLESLLGTRVGLVLGAHALSFLSPRAGTWFRTCWSGKLLRLVQYAIAPARATPWFRWLSWRRDWQAPWLLQPWAPMLWSREPWAPRASREPLLSRPWREPLLSRP